MSDLSRITERYTLDKLIHAGDTASVFRATDLRSGKPVALKLLRGSARFSDPQRRERFESAARALAECSHKCLPTLLDHGVTAGGAVFLVTNYLPGVTLDLLTGSPPERLLPLLLPVLGALEELDHHQLAHRALRAENLLVVPRVPRRLAPGGRVQAARANGWGGENEAGDDGSENEDPDEPPERAPDGDQVKILGWGSATRGSGEEGRRADLGAFAELTCAVLGARVQRTPAAVVTLPAAAGTRTGDAAELAILLSLLLQPGGALPASLYSELRHAFRLALYGGADPEATQPGLLPGATPVLAGPHGRHGDTTSRRSPARPRPAARDLADPEDLEKETQALRGDITMAVPRDRLPLPPPDPPPAAERAAPDFDAAPSAATAAASGASAPRPRSPLTAARIRTETLPSFLASDLASAAGYLPAPSSAIVPFPSGPAEGADSAPVQAQHDVLPPGATDSLAQAQDAPAPRSIDPAAAAPTRTPMAVPPPRIAPRALMPVAPPAAPAAREAGRYLSARPVGRRRRSRGVTAALLVLGGLLAVVAVAGLVALVGGVGVGGVGGVRGVGGLRGGAGPAFLRRLTGSDPAQQPRPAAPAGATANGRRAAASPASAAAPAVLTAPTAPSSGALSAPSAPPLSAPSAPPLSAPSAAPSSVPPSASSSSAPPLDPRLAAALALLTAGDPAGARRALAAIPAAQQAAFAPADRDSLANLTAALAGDQRARRAQIATDLAAGFRRGDLRRLKAALAGARRDPDLPAGVRPDLDRARQAVELDARLAQLAPPASIPPGGPLPPTRDPAELLQAATQLLAILPSHARALGLRGQAARALETQADDALAAGDAGRAATLAASLRQDWPDRPGLQDRGARIEAQQTGDAHLEEILAAAARDEAAGQPLQGLDALAAAPPTGRYRERFGQQRERLNQQLAKLDAAPPSISLRPGWKAEYDKGETVVVPLRITDDLAVKSAEAWVRSLGAAAFQQVPVRHLAGADYEVDLPPTLHRNEPLEIYVTATDNSGHQALLGSRDQPLKIKRRNWIEKIFTGKEKPASPTGGQ
jgi:serine/threonine protein kinase